jgi:heme iron utilization protein
LNTTQGEALRNILTSQPVGGLGTLHDGEPFVSMVPIALMSGGRGFVIHVSGLAAHTKDMLQHPKVSLLVMATQSPDVPPQALPRVTVQCESRLLDERDPAHAPARKAYLDRFPESEMTMALGDFSLFVLTPLALRLVGGFAQAANLTPINMEQALNG